ncbi:copper resistance protein CopC [Staphylococcus sp. 17KM0847]|uniref:copper resistance CopC/CopD family protein n=1 Tax=Staphylococcus sp. 17KM0847 TaxID=2583989 RepID=UPI0015DC0A60|nr:copper resistance protein CopC [Staphylococcus sp. 17KM0847]QLK86731.1 hypothetical protein FGL66_08525 [Staphylococcus sp. 17KM0847]
MTIVKRAVFVCMACMLYIVIMGAQVNDVSAHASLERQQPAHNEVVTETPDILTLEFSEPINTKYTKIQLYNDRGEQVEVLHPIETGYSDKVTFNTKKSKKGTYIAVWDAISLDGHEIEGQYYFSVGEQTATHIDTSKPFYADAFWWLGVLRFMMQASVLILTGLYIVNRLMAKQGAPTYHILTKYRSVAWILIMLISITTIVYLMTLPQEVIQDLFILKTSTWFAFPYILSMFALSIVLILFSLKDMETIWYDAMPVLIFISLATSGHVWAQSWPIYAIVLRTLHLGGIALWLGSFAYLLAYTRVRHQHSYVLILRDVLFKSNITAVLLIIITGILMSVDATSLQAIVTQQTTYSGLWFGKLFYTTLLMLLGAVQTFWAMNKKRRIHKPLLYIELVIGLFLILAGIIMSQIEIPL